MSVTDQAALRDALASAYAAGSLSPGLTLITEAQGALAPTQARAIRAAEEAASALLERTAPAATATSALEAVLARIEETPQEARESRRAPETALDREVAHLPEAVRDAAHAAEASGARWRMRAPGLHILELAKDGEDVIELLRIAPGHGAPTHTHKGEEYTLVLQGAFHDGHARYGVGEISVGTPALTHRPIAEPGPLCYALAVTERGLRFNGLLGLLQRLAGG